jgi:hypothetical protein
MNLYELPDKEFDTLFKKAAEQAEYPFNESAWDGFEQKLNRWEKLNPAFWKISGGLIIVLLGMVTWLILKSPDRTTSELSHVRSISTEETQFENQSDSPLNDPVLRENGKDADNNTQLNFKTQLNEGTGLDDELQQDLNGQKDGGESLDKMRQKDSRIQMNIVTKQESPSQNEITGDKGLLLKEVERNNREITGVESINARAVNSFPDERIDSENSGEKADMYLVRNEGQTGSIMDHRGNQKFREGRLTGLGMPESTGPISETANFGKNTSVLEVVPLKKDRHRLGYSLNFSLGPDFSGVGAKSYGTGTFVGLGFELYFLKNLSLMIGVSHSRKKYTVQDEYSAPYPGIWTYGQVPDQVDIACHVLDIPVNIYYSVYQNGKNMLFVGAGLSSYLMLTEEYHFEYFNQNNPNLIQDYDIRNKNQHYFGIVNLSAGYTRIVNNRWSWQLEPYLKLPIQDIAAAKVRLNSFGALISLKYRFR